MQVIVFSKTPQGPRLVSIYGTDLSPSPPPSYLVNIFVSLLFILLNYSSERAERDDLLIVVLEIYK